MDDLLTALMIFSKYGNPTSPTHCEHDILYVCIDPADVLEEDIDDLKKLGFVPDPEFGDMFSSNRFGSA